MLALRRLSLSFLVICLICAGLPRPALAQGEPTAIIDAVFKDISQKLGRTVTRSNADVWSWEEDVFADASLGCPQPGKTYAQAQTRGFKISVTFNNVTYDYRAFKDGTVIFQCSAGGAAPTAVSITPIAPTVVIGGQPVTYQNPIAYIGAGGNVYITAPGKGAGTAITGDSVSTGNGDFSHRYGQFRWSPDGSKLLFADQTSKTLYLVMSGQKPLQIAGGLSYLFSGAWSPDGTQIAYGVDTRQTRGDNQTVQQIQVLPVTSTGVGAPLVGGEFTFGVGCGGGGSDPAEALYQSEAGYGGNPLTFVWLAKGYLVTGRCTGDLLSLTAPSGQVVWSAEGLSRAAVSADGTKIVAMKRQNTGPSTATSQLVLVDPATGAVTPIQSEPNPDQAAWSADGQSILYSTLEQGQTLKGSLFDGISFKTTLWRMPAAGGPSMQLFQQEGRGIGVIAPAADNSNITISFITSSIGMVQLMNSGASQDQIKAAQPDVSLYLVPWNNGAAQNIGAGGQPAMGKGSFTAVPAVPADQPTVAPANSGVTPPALQINGQAVVTLAQGDILNVRASPSRTAAVVRILKPGAIVTILAGPQVADGYRWWQVRVAEDNSVGWVVDQAPDSSGTMSNTLAPQ